MLSVIKWYLYRLVSAQYYNLFVTVIALSDTLLFLDDILIPILICWILTFLFCFVHVSLLKAD